jgi:DNA-binding NarL/FixJ family response regulator
MTGKIRLLLIEDETLVSEAICALLDMEAGISVVAQAAQAEAGVRKARLLKPDVILLDLRLPDRPGIEVISELLQNDPQVQVVVVSGMADEQEVAAAFRAGAVGYVLKSQTITDLVQAIENALEGRSSVPPHIAKLMLQKFRPSSKSTSTAGNLSAAEQRILVCVAQGMEDKEIARHVGLRRSTVCSHVCHILIKLNVENRTQAAIYAIKHGWVATGAPSSQERLRASPGRYVPSSLQ